MATFTFGTAVNPAHYVEIPDGVTNPPARPASSGVLKVRNAVDLTALPDDSFDAVTGYFGFTTTDIPIVQVSADSGVTWVPLIGIEAEEAGANAGAVAQQALVTATNADTKATQALAAAGSGITIAGVGPQATFTLTQIHARDDRVAITPADTSGFGLVATTNAGADLDDFGFPGGTAQLDSSGFVINSDGTRPASSGGSGDIEIFQNPDGTYPARNLSTTDPRVSVVYIPAYDVTKRPTIGTDLSTAFAVDPANKYPGDRFRNLQAAVA